MWIAPRIITDRNEVAKVMFLHVSVILFTGGCYPSMHCRWYPSMPCSRGVPVAGGACSRGVPAPGGTCPRGLLPGGCSLRGDLLGGGLLCGGGGWRPPPRRQTATGVDVTHPTGMHSCWMEQPPLLGGHHSVNTEIHFVPVHSNLWFIHTAWDPERWVSTLRINVVITLVVSCNETGTWTRTRTIQDNRYWPLSLLRL